MRNLSLAARQSMMAQQTDVVWHILLTISHESLLEPIRVVNNTENVTSRGNVFQAFPFLINIPEDSAERTPTVQLQIDNIDRSITQTIRSLASKPTIILEIITSADTDQLEVGPFEFQLSNVDYDAMLITGTLNYEPILFQPYPSDTFTPSTCPGLF